MSTDSKHPGLDELQGEFMDYALTFDSDYDDARAHEPWSLSFMVNGQSAELDEADEHISSLLAEDTTDQTLDAVYGTVELAGAICQLPDRYRIPYTLFVKGYGIEEIAIRTSMPVIKARRIIYTAQRMVKNGFAVNTTDSNVYRMPNDLLLSFEMDDTHSKGLIGQFMRHIGVAILKLSFKILNSSLSRSM